MDKLKGLRAIKRRLIHNAKHNRLGKTDVCLGLCGIINELKYEDKLSAETRDWFRGIIKNRAKSQTRFWRHNDMVTGFPDQFQWLPHDHKSRVMFLEELIKQHKS